MASLERVFRMKFSGLYPLYISKVERKGRTRSELERVICWLTGYSHDGLERQIAQQVSLEEFFSQAPAMNPNTVLIKGLVCGVRVEEVPDPLMRKIRCMDKLVDELAKGKAMEKILRQ